MPASSHRQRRHSAQQIARTRRDHVLWLSLLVLVVFASALGGDFVWTDRDDILRGEHRLTELADVPAALSLSRAAYRQRHDADATVAAGGTWQPLTLLSNSLSWTIWRDCAFCFHLENLILHGLTVVGLYALGRHLLRLRRNGARLAAWAAALFAVHPATVTSVAWIGGRDHLLAAVLGVWCLVLFTRLPATSKSHVGATRRWWIGLALAGLAAMLAHESAYLLPLLALLIAAYESRQRERHPLGGISGRRWLGLGLLIASLLLVLGYRNSVLGGLGFGADYPTESLFNNLGTALRHFWFLIELALVPAEPIVSDAWRITLAWGAAEVAALLGLILVLGVTLLGLFLGHPSALGSSWFLIAIVPGVGIFPSTHYHDGQSLYLALWGVSFAVTCALDQLWRPLGRQLVPGSEGLMFVPAIIVLGVITAFSNARWWTHNGLFESEIASDPHYMEGRLQLTASALEAGDPATAANHALAAIEASGDGQYTGYWSARDAYLLLGRAQWELGAFEQAIDSLDKALQARPGDADALHWLGVVQLSMEAYAEAETSLRAALQVRQTFPDAAADLGVALAGQERFVEAYPLLAEAIGEGLGNARRHRALALTLIDGNALEAAADHLEQALALRDNAVDRARLAWLAWRLERHAEAQRHLQMALQDDAGQDPYIDWVRTQLSASDDNPDAAPE